MPNFNKSGACKGNMFGKRRGLKQGCNRRKNNKLNKSSFEKEDNVNDFKWRSNSSIKNKINIQGNKIDG